MQAMLTHDDLKAIRTLLDEKLANYPTKADLDEKLRQQKKELLAAMDERLRGQKTGHLVEISKLRKEIVNGIDDLAIDYFDTHPSSKLNQLRPRS